MKLKSIMTSDDTVDPPKNTLCRDFLRKICHRGNKCKFKHPEDSSILIKELDFCHDYQNKECTRPNCKFFHVTRKEQQYFEATGILPKHLLEAIARAKDENQLFSNKNGDAQNCKDFNKCECCKLGRCGYLHSDSKKNDKEIGIPIKKHTLAEVYSNYESYGSAPNYGDPEPKRRVVDEIYAPPRREAILRPAPPHSNAATFNEYCMTAEDEVALLRRKVEELKKQVSDLQATNEFLLDQNAQLRLSKHTTTVSPLTAQALIPHTLTAPTVAALQPATAATISQISQQLSSDLAAQSTLRPAELATPTIVPVAPVSIASAVSLASAALPAASLSQSLAQSIITMSGPSTSLVSYPIMTQSLRPVIPHSLGN